MANKDTKDRYSLTWKGFLLLWLLGCVIIVIRRPDMLFNPQPWSEDSMFFLRDVIFFDWKSFVIPYAGYLHLVPRLLTALAFYISSELGAGIAYVPLIMNLLAIIISSYCAILICSRRFNWMGNIFFRLLVSLFILTFPGAAEIYGNVTNLHWWLGIVAFLLCWDMFQKNNMPTWRDTIFLTVIVLTSPNGLIVLPALAGFYVLRNKFKLSKDLYKVGVVGIFTLLQLLLIYTSRPQSLTGNSIIHPDLFSGSCGFLFTGVSANMFIVDCEAFATMNGGGYFILKVIGAILLLLMLVFGWRHRRQLYVPFTLLALVITITVFGTKVSIDFKDNYTTEAQRYIFLPAIIIFTILVYEFAALFSAVKKNKIYIPNGFERIKLILLACFLLLVAINIYDKYKFIPFPDNNWKARTAVYDEKGLVDFFIPIYPYAYYFGFPSLCGAECIEQHVANLSGCPIDVDERFMVWKDNVEYTDSLYTFTGTNAVMVYQLPENADLQYCYIHFDRAPVLEQLQLLCLTEKGEPLFPVAITCAPVGNHQQYMIEITPVMKNVRFVQLRLTNVKNMAIGIKQLTFYTVKMK